MVWKGGHDGKSIYRDLQMLNACFRQAVGVEMMFASSVPEENFFPPPETDEHLPAPPPLPPSLQIEEGTEHLLKYRTYHKPSECEPAAV